MEVARKSTRCSSETDIFALDEDITHTQPGFRGEHRCTPTRQNEEPGEVLEEEGLDTRSFYGISTAPTVSNGPESDVGDNGEAEEDEGSSPFELLPSLTPPLPVAPVSAGEVNPARPKSLLRTPLGHGPANASLERPPKQLNFNHYDLSQRLETVQRVVDLVMARVSLQFPAYENPERVASLAIASILSRHFGTPTIGLGCTTSPATKSTAKCPLGWLDSIVAISGEEPGDLSTTIIVDCDLKSKFMIARPTPRFMEYLSSIPNVFVGTMVDLSDAVYAHSYAVHHTLMEQGMDTAPWRKPDPLMQNYRAVALSAHTEGNLTMSNAMATILHHVSASGVSSSSSSFAEFAILRNALMKFASISLQIVERARAVYCQITQSKAFVNLPAISDPDPEPPWVVSQARNPPEEYYFEKSPPTVVNMGSDLRSELAAQLEAVGRLASSVTRAADSESTRF